MHGFRTIGMQWKESIRGSNRKNYDCKTRYTIRMSYRAHGEKGNIMVAEFNGLLVKIPKGYRPAEDGLYVDGHGVEYALVQYGSGDDLTICLETVYSKHVRTVPLELYERKGI